MGDNPRKGAPNHKCEYKRVVDRTIDERDVYACKCGRLHIPTKDDP